MDPGPCLMWEYRRVGVILKVREELSARGTAILGLTDLENRPIRSPSLTGNTDVAVHPRPRDNQHIGLGESPDGGVSTEASNRMYEFPSVGFGASEPLVRVGSDDGRTLLSQSLGEPSHTRHDLKNSSVANPLRESGGERSRDQRIHSKALSFGTWFVTKACV